MPNLNPNPLKYSAVTQTEALKSGNYWIGTGDVSKGPTLDTNYWNSITPPSGGYTVNLGSGDFPATFCPASDAELIGFTNRIAGTSYTTATECLAYYATQVDKDCLNISYEQIVTSGLVMLLDAGFTPSYPRAGTTSYDLSGAGNNGTFFNGPTYSSNAGGSFVFDGTNDYASTPTAIGSSLTGDFTFSVFAKRNGNSASAINGLISNEWHSAFTGVSMFLRNNDTEISIEAGNGTTRPAYSLTSPFINLYWTSYTLTIQGTTFSVYVNGKLLNSRSVSVLQDPTRGVFLARWAGSFNSYYLNGEISQALVYNRALSSSEVLQNYQSMLTRYLGENIVTQNLSLYLDAGYPSSYAGTGTVWRDVSGGGTNGTLINGPTFTSSYGGTIVFDGTNDYVNTNYTITTPSFTVNIVFQSVVSVPWDVLWACEVWNNGTGFLGYFTNSTTLNFGRGGTTFNNVIVTTSATQLAYYTFTLNNNLASIYINGVLAGSTTFTTVPIIQKPILLSTRYSNDGTGITDATQANISLFEVYDRALSSAEILQNFNAQRSRFGL